MPFDNNGKVGSGQILNETNTTAEVTSDAMDLRGMATLSICVNNPARSTATAHIMEMDISESASGPWFPLQNQNPTPPDKALVTQTWTKSGIAAADTRYAVDLDEAHILNKPFARLRVAVTGGSASDSITIDAYAESSGFRI